MEEKDGVGFLVNKVRPPCAGLKAACSIWCSTE